ncbi:MAG TPA: PDZ domain-containing protein [Sphingomicrobium sp.]|nr:PDZ domain-containing protein [Sphingomicrobium sp.]
MLVIAALLLLAAYQWSREAELRQEQRATVTLVRTLGVTVRPLDPQLAGELHVLPDASGLVVTSVADGRPAARAGLKPGDVIEQVDGYAVVDTQSLAFALDHDPSPSLVIQADRGGREFTFRVPRA